MSLYEIPTRRHLWLIFLTYLFISVLALPVLAETAAQLLEKGIYTEETVGDLDKAIEVYTKVVAEAKDSINAAAEAQYRMGLCYAKQGKEQEASAAFQAVVDNYPGASQWVESASSRLAQGPELLPVPWGDGDELQLEMKLPSGLGVGYQVFRVGKIEQDGESHWRCDGWQVVTLNGMSGRSYVLADLETFAPQKSYWKHTMLGEAKATYSQDQAVIQMANKDQPTEIKLDGVYYDNEQGAEAFRRLPLKEGAELKLNILSILTGAKLAIALKVSAVETLTVPAGTYECFRLELPELGQTFWISTDEHRYIVRFAATGVTADLVRIRPFEPEKSQSVELESATLTLPPDWFAYTPSKIEQGNKHESWLVTPQAVFPARLEAGGLEALKRKFDTPQAWLEHQLEDNKSAQQGFQLTSDGIQATKLDDQPAATAEYQYSDGERTIKVVRVVCYGKTAAADLQFNVPEEQFAELRGDMDSIIASLHVK